MVAPVDETVEVVMGRARSVDLVERSEVLASVERGLFGRASPRQPLTFGRFVLLERLGGGGGGVVHAAYDPELDRKVALKLLEPVRSEDTTQARERLLREAQALASLSHPNVLAIHDVGTFDEEQARELSGARVAGVYLVTELVDGPDLRTWLRERPRTAREILEVFAAAAEGIAAAHHKGIIHRDIKPANIVVGSDGRARVVDFGLARKLEPGSNASPPDAPDAAAADGRTPGRTSLALSITAHGTVMGTPPYMAPEQHEAAKTDERTDQYSFCVSLFEALYGQRPFEGKTNEELAAAKRSGRLVSPPSGRGVPRWIRDVLARGLAIDPADRHPNMPALVAALRDDPVRRWTRRGAWMGAMLVVASLTMVTWRARAQQVRACTATEALEGTWDEATRQRVAARFSASELPYANRVFEHVEGKLDRWVIEWTEAWETTCRAAMMERSTSVGDMGRTALCLERRLQQASGIVGVLLDADDSVIRRAEEIAQDLPDSAACSSLSARSDPELPSPEQRARLLSIERQLAEATALREAGRYDSAAELASTVLEAGRALDDLQLVARAQALLGTITQIQGRGAESERWLRASILTSERADDELLTIEVTLTRAFGLAIHRARPAEALELVEQCIARLEKHGEVPLLQARVAFIQGRAREAGGEHEEALAAFVQALALYERAIGSDHPRTVGVLNNVGVAHDRLGHYDEALRYYTRTLDARRARYGDAHPDTANALGNVGAAYASLGRCAEAEKPLREASAVFEEAFGQDHRLVAWYRANLGNALRCLGRHEEARRELEAAVRIRTRVLGIEHPHTAEAHTDLAQVLVDLGRGQQALASAEAAASIAGQWPDRSFLGAARHARGRALHLLGRSRMEVEHELREALLLSETARGRDHVETAEVRLSLARAALDWHDPTLAREHGEEALRLLESAPVDERRRIPARKLVAEIDSTRLDDER